MPFQPAVRGAGPQGPDGPEPGFRPGSGIRPVGFRAPNREQVISTAAAGTVPEVRYGSWDIAVTENGADPVKGDHDPGHHVVRMTTQGGFCPAARKLASYGPG